MLMKSSSIDDVSAMNVSQLPMMKVGILRRPTLGKQKIISKGGTKHGNNSTGETLQSNSLGIAFP